MYLNVLGSDFVFLLRANSDMIPMHKGRLARKRSVEREREVLNKSAMIPSSVPGRKPERTSYIIAT